MRFQSVQLNNGKVLSGDTIEELVTDIVNKFPKLDYPVMKVSLFWKVRAMF